MFCILPFEVDFFEKKHHYDVHYVGNPTADEVREFKAGYHQSYEDFCLENNLDPQRPVIALLAGSRKQESWQRCSTHHRPCKTWKEACKTTQGQSIEGELS